MNFWKRVALFVCPCLPLLLLLPLAAPLPLAAQAQPAVMAASSPEVYEAFFRFHDDLSRWSDQRKSLNALEAPSLDSAVARHLKLDPSELNKLNAVTQGVMVDLRKIDNDLQAYVNSRARYEQLPKPADMQQFALRRQQAVQDGVTKLQKMLSNGSWNGLHDYIDNVHRLRYRAAQVSKK